MDAINPYGRNTEILRRFFSKSLILLIAIFFTASVLAQTILGALQLTSYPFDGTSDYFWFLLSINFLDIMPAIAFFLLYFKSRKRNHNISYNAPVVLMKIYSIINIVLISIAIALIVVIMIVVLLNPTTDAVNSEVFKFLADFLIILILASFFVIIPVIFIGLFYYISMLSLFGSVNKSTHSIYLCKRGSVFFAVMAIILAVINLFILLCSIPALNNLTPNFLSDAGTDFAIIDGFTKIETSDIYNIISSSITTVLYSLLAVFAFSYRKYISKVSTVIVENAPAKSAQNNNKYGNSITSNTHPAGQFNRQPFNFTPQPVFKSNNSNLQSSPAADNVNSVSNNSCAKPIGEIHNNKAQNPYAANNNERTAPYYRTQNLQTQQNPYLNFYNAPQKSHCPNCGYELTNSSVFCGNCGCKIN